MRIPGSIVPKARESTKKPRTAAKKEAAPKKKAPAKRTGFKRPASWAVPGVGGVFKGPVQTQVSKVAKARSALNRLMDEMDVARVIRPDGTKRLYDEEDIYDEMPIMALIRIANNPPESLCLIN